MKQFAKYVGVFLLGALAMYVFLWYQVLHDFVEVWQKIYQP